MTNEQINIAIAEACGWKHIIAIRGTLRGWKTDSEKEDSQVLPDYSNDLNAMHEAEKVLILTLRRTDLPRYVAENDANEYLHNLRHVLGYGDGDLHEIHATAAQRAEAFLRTIGKWEGETK